jgi:serine phosphatase RsbU (regulator of sigma subunit)
MFRLRVTPPESQPFDHRFTGEELIVGRAPDCGLVIADPFLSRHHARLFRRGEELYVEDLGSSNGTLLNGTRISGAATVRPGDGIRISDTSIAVLEGGPAAGAGEPEGITVLRPVTELLAREAEPAGEGAGLRRHADRLRLLNDLHRALARSIALDELLELVLDGAFQHLGPEQAVILLRDADGELAPAASRAVPGVAAQGLVSQTLVREVVDKGQAALAVDTQADARFAGAESIIAAGARSLMAVPLADAEGCLGMIAVYSRLTKRAFNEEDLELLASMAAVAALRVRNVSLAQAAAERERLESELQSARRLQMSLLPKFLPEPPGYELWASNDASRVVSGDYYQVMERNGGQECAVLIADVSGKGMAAALLTASLEAICSGLIAAGGEPQEILATVCRFLYERTPPDKFATAVLAVLAPESGVLSMVNAGHNPPCLLRSGGAVEQIDAGGFPLGLLPQADYARQDLTLAPGDLVVLYTDGIVEAANPAGDEFGLDRLIEICLTERTAPLAEIGAAIERELLTFAAGVPFGDDRTLLLLRRTA